jgi:hypothetical protein
LSTGGEAHTLSDLLKAAASQHGEGSPIAAPAVACACDVFVLQLRSQALKHVLLQPIIQTALQ